jgi:hypothetical protein
MIDEDEEAAAKARKAARARAWYAANKEVAIARARAWNAEHPAEHLAGIRAWQARNRDRVNAYARARYRRRNPASSS